MRATNTYSLDAMYQVATTILLESKLTHLKQLPEGPALGFGQVEWPTYLDCCRYLTGNITLRCAILNYCERTFMPINPISLIGDLVLNVLIVRVKYWMIPEPIPSYKDIAGQAAYYKKYYNTAEGAASIESFEKCAQDLRGWINHGEGESS